MDPFDLLLILVVPLLSFVGLLVAVYLLLSIGRGVTSLLPARDSESTINLDNEAAPIPEVAELTAADRAYERTEPVHRVEIVAQLLFAHLRHDGIFVDTLILEAKGDAEGVIPAGNPLSLRVQRTDSDVLGACSEALLELWAERGEIVAINLRVQGDDVRAELSNGSSRMVLDVSEAAGLG